MTIGDGKIYEFGQFTLNAGEKMLLSNGEPVTTTPKVFDLLVLLVENHGRLMSKEELIAELWQDSFVEEANLNVNISALRRVLGETPNEHRFIETVPRRGYRFVAEVRERPTVGGAGTERSSETAAATIEHGTKPKHRRFLRVAALLVAVASLAAAVVAWRVYFEKPGTDVTQLRTIAVLPFRPLAGGQADPALQMVWRTRSSRS